MKTAVLFFGEIRGTSEHWQKVYDMLIKPNNADVFMAFTTYNPSFLDSYSDDQRALLESYYINKGVNYYPSRDLLDIFKPVVLRCDPKYSYPLEYYDTFVNKVNHVHSLTINNNFNYDCTKLAYYAIMNQHDTRTTVMQLKYDYEKKTGIQYDNVILTRLDINPISTIEFPTRLSRMCVRGSSYFINEQLIAGPSDTMNVFLHLLEDMPKIYEDNCNMQHHFMQNEYHICIFLRKHGIVTQSIDIPLGYHIEHSNGLIRFNFSFK
jgi:hypothetical protein